MMEELKLDAKDKTSFHTFFEAMRVKKDSAVSTFSNTDSYIPFNARSESVLYSGGTVISPAMGSHSPRFFNQGGGTGECACD